MDSCDYLYSPNKNEFLLLNPLFYDVAKKKLKGLSDLDVQNELAELESFPENNKSTYEYIQFYIDKYYMLKNSGYFKDYKADKSFSGRSTAKDIEIAFSNTVLIIFEVTDKCNLKCHYCAYGRLYSNYDPRENKNMSFATAKTFLDNFVKRRDSKLNKSFKKKTRINFYGGEPLLNIDFIKKIIQYIEDNKLENLFDYGMTTNGTLLRKHIDYLVRKNFDIVISLDGDRVSDSLRPFKNGKLSYNIVYDNIIFIKNNYKAYFYKHIKYSTVYHSKSNIENLNGYFKTNFGASPMISEINPNGIKPDMYERYCRLYKSLQSDLENIPENSSILKELHTVNNYTDGLHKIFLSNSNCGPITRLLSKELLPKVPSATCLPFNRSIYISVNGKLFLCERIGHDNYLGNFSENMDLDFNEIAHKIKDKYDILKSQCSKCYMVHFCPQCVMTLDTINGQIKCPSYRNAKTFSTYITRTFIHFEKNPEIYSSFMLNA